MKKLKLFLDQELMNQEIQCKINLSIKFKEDIVDNLVQHKQEVDNKSSTMNLDQDHMILNK